jgi:hypothetical protein
MCLTSCEEEGKRIAQGIDQRMDFGAQSALATPDRLVLAVFFWGGVQYVSIKYTERLAEAGLEPSVGSVGGREQRCDRSDAWTRCLTSRGVTPGSELRACKYKLVLLLPAD